MPSPLVFTLVQESANRPYDWASHLTMIDVRQLDGFGDYITHLSFSHKSHPTLSLNLISSLKAPFPKRWLSLFLIFAFFNVKC